MRNKKKQTILRDYITSFAKDFQLRYSYIRDKQGTKIGVAASFMKNGKVMVGVSKSHRKVIEFEMASKKQVKQVGDEFEVNYGLARAIERAVPFDQFVAMNTLKQLPKLPVGRRASRDTNGKVLERLNQNGKKVVITEEFDQYKSFIERTQRYYRIGQEEALEAAA